VAQYLQQQVIMHTLSLFNRMNELLSELPNPNNYWSEQAYGRLVEKKDFFKLKLNLAGASKETVSISYHDDMLTVLGKTDEGIDYHYKCHIPKGKVDAKKAKSKYENGILTVTLPKVAAAKAISIKLD
tara:strand:- start:15 stop:398 length:384 start_codon:yes stop_codon:yes gene_type:complete